MYIRLCKLGGALASSLHRSKEKVLPPHWMAIGSVEPTISVGGVCTENAVLMRLGDDVLKECMKLT